MSRRSVSAWAGELLLLDTSEAAAFLGCCRATVQAYARKGRIPAQVIAGGWRFRQEDLESFMAGEIGRPPKRERPDTRTEADKREAAAARERLEGWPF